MSLTSYRAAPPRVNLWALFIPGTGTAFLVDGDVGSGLELTCKSVFGNGSQYWTFGLRVFFEDLAATYSPTP